jgi:putative membrane protein
VLKHFALFTPIAMLIAMVIWAKSQTLTAQTIPATQPTPATQPLDDRVFVQKAAAGGMMEVQLGRLALQHARSPDVKQFGQRMVDDHSKANDELKLLATAKSIALPEKLPPEEQKHVDRLAALDGPDFDRQYMDLMVDDHREDVALFATHAKTGQDPDIKAFAAKHEPALRAHLAQAEKVAASLR